MDPACPHWSLQTDNIRHIPKETSQMQGVNILLSQGPILPLSLGTYPRGSAQPRARLSSSDCSSLTPSSHKGSQKGPMVVGAGAGGGGGRGGWEQTQRRGLNNARSESLGKGPLHPPALGSPIQMSRFPTHLGPSGAHIVRYQFLAKPWSKGLYS